jgi:hypothetical protein
VKIGVSALQALSLISLGTEAFDPGRGCDSPSGLKPNQPFGLQTKKFFRLQTRSENQK